MLISHFSKWVLPVGLVVSELGVRYYHFAPWRRNREKGDNIMVILGKRDGSLGTWALSGIFYVYDSVYIKSWQLNGNKLLVNILIRLHTSYQNIKLTFPPYSQLSFLFTYCFINKNYQHQYIWYWVYIL